jgi:hypothetical protein
MQAGTLIPPAFGLAGVNLATWTAALGRFCKYLTEDGAVNTGGDLEFQHKARRRRRRGTPTKTMPLKPLNMFQFVDLHQSNKIIFRHSHGGGA